MIKTSTGSAHKYALLNQVLAWHRTALGELTYRLDRSILQQSASTLAPGSAPFGDTFVGELVRKVLADCPVSSAGMAYLQSMPNPGWIWTAVNLVLSYRDSEDFARPISLFELQYAVYAYGMAGHADYDLSLSLEERTPGQIGRLLLDGYVLMSEEDGEPVLVPNPIFIFPPELH